MTSVQELIDRILENDLGGHNYVERPPWRGNFSLDDGRFGATKRLPDSYEFDTDPGDGNEEQEGRILDGETRREIGDEVEEEGVEALAYYIPFHADRRKWGIYIRESGLAYVADYLIETGRMLQRASSDVVSTARS